MSIRVLIVDADNRFAAQAAGILQAQGHVVACESDPRQALKRARQWQAEVVIASAELPDCRHGDFLPALQAFEYRPAVVLTASLARFDAAWQAWQRGGDELLFKPLIHPSELKSAVLIARQKMLCNHRQAPLARAA